MTKEMTGAIVLLVAGGAFAALVARGIISGKSYSTYPPMAVFRKEDPFAFWLSLLFPAGFGILLIIGGCVALYNAVNST